MDKGNFKMAKTILQNQFENITLFLKEKLEFSNIAKHVNLTEICVS